MSVLNRATSCMASVPDQLFFFFWKGYQWFEYGLNRIECPSFAPKYGSDRVKEHKRPPYILSALWLVQGRSEERCILYFAKRPCTSILPYWPPPSIIMY